MEHITIVKDADPYFEIKADTREIINKSTTKVKIMQFDHNSERFTFSLPRHIENHDMLECDSIRVHYTVMDLATKESENGIYDVTDIQVDPDDETKAICTWLISQNVTKIAGPLTFVLKCQCYGDDGEVTYSWSTDKFVGFTVSSGINNTEFVVTTYTDILEQWRNNIFNSIGDGVIDINNAKYDAIDDIESKGLEIYDRLYSRPIKKIPVVLASNKEYNFGEVTDLDLTFPSIANDGDVIFISFFSGESATTLTIDLTNTCDFETIPESNRYYDIFAKYNGTIWLLNYNEYAVNEV